MCQYCKILFILFSSLSFLFADNQASGNEVRNKSAVRYQNVTLDECIEMALRNNQQKAISELSIAISEAQHKQVLSSYWPGVDLQSAISRLDQDPYSVARERTDNYLVTGLPLPNIPPGMPLELAVTVPQQNVKLRDRDTWESALTVTYPLFTGFRRSALRAQTSAGIDISHLDAKRTELQIIKDVKTRYYGHVLAKKLYNLGQEAIIRMEVTLQLTENLYKTGSGFVKKTDYLRNKMMVSSVRGMVTQLESNMELSRAALINTMGIGWDAELSVPESDIPLETQNLILDNLVSTFHQSTPEWLKMNLGLEVMEAKIREAKSDHYPTIALFASLMHIENSYDAGVVRDDDKDRWVMGVALNLPLFNGFRTSHKISESKYRLEKLNKQKILLEEGIALQVKHLYLQLLSARKRVESSTEAMTAAVENRDLNERAYQQELVETKEVIESQIMESLAQAQYYKALYDQYAFAADLEHLLGYELNKVVSND